MYNSPLKIYSNNLIQLSLLRMFSLCALCLGVQAAAPRSTTVILVKNLPAGVTVSELEELFSTHGSLGRVLLPPSGLTAIIEFLEPTEAKRAFTRLAYSKVCISFTNKTCSWNLFLRRGNLKMSTHLFKKNLVSTHPIVFGVGTCRGICSSQTGTR